GKPSIIQPKVNTIVIKNENGSCDSSLSLHCLGFHPEDGSFLNTFTFNVQINGRNFVAADSALNSVTKKYTWNLSLELIFDSAPHDYNLIVGDPAIFFITPGEGLASLQAMVPQFMPVPTNLTPNNGATLTLPGILSWTNAQASGVDITIEIWQGTLLKWSLITANVSSVNCTATLDPGVYTWLVRTTDSDGNTAATEATFTIP
ncbi:MAG: hypothetical protein Q8O74_01295, partial [bacterium]|nr:hypothetical protein [bacterium]